MISYVFVDSISSFLHNEPSYDKTNKITCASCENWDHPGYSPSLVSRLHCALSVSSCEQQRLLTGWADASEYSLGAQVILLFFFPAVAHNELLSAKKKTTAVMRQSETRRRQPTETFRLKSKQKRLVKRGYYVLLTCQHRQGVKSLLLCCPLLKTPRIVLLDSPDWWGLGTEEEEGTSK